MAWDDKSGNKGRNPWGSPPGGGGGRGPWGSNGGNGGGEGPNQPDFDDIFGKMQDNFRGMMPGNFGGGKLILAGVSALALLWLASGFYIVNPGEHAVVQRFGAWNRTIDNEGLKYRVPAPVENVTTLNVNEIRTLNIGFTGPSTARGSNAATGRDVPDESLMLTSDFNIVDVDFVVQWNISSAEDFVFNIESPENTLRKAAQSAMREVVGQTRMFNIITTERGAVGDNAKAILQKTLNDYGAGINITQVLINSAQVHPDVQNAFQDVQAAKQDAEDVQNRAGAYSEDIIPKARGEAKRIEQEAIAYQQSVIARAKGDASRFNSVLAAYQTGQDVTKERMYLETMEEVLKNAQKIIMDENSGKGVVPYLPLNELNRTAPAAGGTNKGQSQ